MHYTGEEGREKIDTDKRDCKVKNGISSETNLAKIFDGYHWCNYTLLSV